MWIDTLISFLCMWKVWSYFVYTTKPDGNDELVKKVALVLKLINSHEWPRQNFSLQYQYNINQISDENKEKYKFGDN